MKNSKNNDVFLYHNVVSDIDANIRLNKHITDEPNLKKHRETCAKKRRLRKSKRK